MYYIYVLIFGTDKGWIGLHANYYTHVFLTPICLTNVGGDVEY